MKLEVEREEVERGGESGDQQCTSARGLEENTVSKPTYTVQSGFLLLWMSVLKHQLHILGVIRNKC